jgi:hypothetical protein
VGVKDVENLTLDDIKPITISFKKTEEEFILFKWILRHSGYSSFIKDKLTEVKETEEKGFKSNTEQPKSKLIDMDF